MRTEHESRNQMPGRTPRASLTLRMAGQPCPGSRGQGLGLEPALFASPWGLTHFVRRQRSGQGCEALLPGLRGPSGDTGPPGATRTELFLHTHTHEVPCSPQLRARGRLNTGRQTGPRGIRALGGGTGLQRQGQAVAAHRAGNGSCGGTREGRGGRLATALLLAWGVGTGPSSFKLRSDT